MQYKVKRVTKWKSVPDDYKIFYKKWWWLFWKDSGILSKDKNKLLQLVHAWVKDDCKQG